MKKPSTKLLKITFLTNLQGLFCVTDFFALSAILPTDCNLASITIHQIYIIIIIVLRSLANPPRHVLS
jgi:hypothetical protein